MNPFKDSFTDPSQLGEMNAKVWKAINKDHEIIEKVKSEFDDTLQPSQSAAIVDEAGANATEIPPPAV